MDNQSSLIAGVLTLQAVVTPENEQKARTALLAEAERLVKTGASADELSSAKAMAVTLNLLRLQSERYRMLEYARTLFYQKQAADVENFAERVSKVSVEEIKRTAAAYLKAPAASTGIVRGIQTQAK